MAPHQAIQWSLLAPPIRITAALGEQCNSLLLRKPGE
jgi:hypothetical protein